MTQVISFPLRANPEGQNPRWTKDYIAMWGRNPVTYKLRANHHEFLSASLHWANTEAARFFAMGYTVSITRVA